MESKDTAQPKQSCKDYYMQKGRREVVKWIEKEYGYFIDDGLAKIIIDDNGYYGRPDSIAKYQSQKKKWGISNEKL